MTKHLSDFHFSVKPKHLNHQNVKNLKNKDHKLGKSCTYEADFVPQKLKE